MSENGSIPAINLIETGKLGQYMEDRPESSRRIQEELKGVDLLAGGNEKRSGIPAKLLIERAELEKYMEDRPESSRRIQEELKGIDLLAGGQAKGGVPVKLLIERGQLEQYMEDRPESSRRILEEMKSVEMLSKGHEKFPSGEAPASAMLGSPRASSLPRGWEKKRTPDGELFYVNHSDKSTHWTLPSGVTLGEETSDETGWGDWMGNLAAKAYALVPALPPTLAAAMPSFSFVGEPDPEKSPGLTSIWQYFSRTSESAVEVSVVDSRPGA